MCAFVLSSNIAQNADTKVQLGGERGAHGGTLNLVT